jgi:RNA-directed DNA polymerase
LAGRELGERLAGFALELGAEQTRLIEFGRSAAHNRSRRGLGKPETFSFLGFTHICAKTRKGCFKLKRVTDKKRMRAKVGGVSADVWRRMHLPVPDQRRWCGVSLGHFNYYAVPTTARRWPPSATRSDEPWLQTLRRRSQRSRTTWVRFGRHAAGWLRPVRVLHPWPQARFAATTQGGSPVS